MARANRLADETSPYLLQHAHNPVDWYPWGDEAFARARAEAKPVLLSIGYSACHWCHVMERESFENADTAALMNDRFVNIKVDREERPDVDDVYMRRCNDRRGAGRSPSPDARRASLLAAPTSRRRSARHAGVSRVLEAVSRAFHDQPDDGPRRSRSWCPACSGRGGRADRRRVDRRCHRGQRCRCVTSTRCTVPRRRSQASTHPRLPPPPQWRVTQRQDLLDAVVLTCRHGRRGTTTRSAAGFIATRSTRWLVPHFEKMLYDNAEIPRLYLSCSRPRRSGAPPRRRRRSTICCGRCGTPMGAFTSHRRRQRGREGKFFWTPAEIAAVVDPPTWTFAATGT